MGQALTAGYCPESAASPRRTVRASVIFAINRVSFWECSATQLRTLCAAVAFSKRFQEREFTSRSRATMRFA
jgi:hypothetical protein